MNIFQNLYINKEIFKSVNIKIYVQLIIANKFVIENTKNEGVLMYCFLLLIYIFFLVFIFFYLIKL